MTTTCKNCENSFEGNFCNNCGQTANTFDINFKSTMHDIQHSIFHIDKGILYTTKELFRSPGQTIRSYLNGKRVKHFKPFAYVFVLSTIYAILTRLSHKSTLLNDFLDGFYRGASDAESQSGLGLFGEVLQWMSSHYAYATLLIIPIFSFASYICFRKAQYNYFQHLILNSFVAGLRTSVFLILLPFTYFITDKSANDIFDSVKAYLSVGLTIWMYYCFFNSYNPFVRVLLTILAYLTMIILLVLLVLMMGLIQIMWG
jgi:hypothetical protein